MTASRRGRTAKRTRGWRCSVSPPGSIVRTPSRSARSPAGTRARTTTIRRSPTTAAPLRGRGATPRSPGTRRKPSRTPGGSWCGGCRARRRQLAPADQKLFTRDSTARSQAVAQARASRAATLTELAESDRVLQTAFAAAIAALKEYLAVYPDAVEAAVALAALLGQSNRLAESAAVFDSLSAHAKGLDPAELLAAGERFVGQGLYRPGVRALAIGLERNPYRREALYSLAVGYYELRDSTNLLPAAQRLLALDPLSRSVLKLVAAGWDFRGRSDSAAAYVTRAGFDLAVEVTVPSFLSDSTGASLTAFATNLKPAASKPFGLTVEFLDARGQVVATASHDVPTIPARQSFKVDLKVSGPGIAGWRYRAS